jgi:UDP-galactopyranose mutase
MKPNHSVLIVGAGLSGCTIARSLADIGVQCTVIDRRDHIAGNAFDSNNQIGIKQHHYGPHLFHTSNQKVVDFLSRFTEWTHYKHKVKAQLQDGALVTLPINRETKSIVGAENCVEIFIRPYSEKMWGMALESIDPKIINRVPMRDDMNEYYFPNDSFQALPTHGYTPMVQAILDHPGITVQLNTEFDNTDIHNFDHIFYSGPIDEFVDFKFGPLPYRSIKFHNVNVPVEQLYPVSVVNFTDKGKFTRVVEWKNLPNHGSNASHTTLTFEEPCDYKDNNMERYYPVKDTSGEYKKLYETYWEYAQANFPTVTFCGRLGLYAYLDMHQAISSALKLAEKWIESNRD